MSPVPLHVREIVKIPSRVQGPDFVAVTPPGLYVERRRLEALPDVASAGELAEISRRSATLRNVSSYVDVRVARRSHVLAAEGSATPGGAVLIEEGRLTATSGRTAVARCGPDLERERRGVAADVGREMGRMVARRR